MIRTTITLDDELDAGLEAYIARAKMANKSEAIRDLIRRGLASEAQADPDHICVAVISCAIDQAMTGMTKRLRETRLARHDEIAFYTSIPLNHRETIDITVLKAAFSRVSEFSAQMLAERGVRHATVNCVPIQEHVEEHSHDGEDPHAHSHLHVQQSF